MKAKTAIPIHTLTVLEQPNSVRYKYILNGIQLGRGIYSMKTRCMPTYTLAVIKYDPKRIDDEFRMMVAESL